MNFIRRRRELLSGRKFLCRILTELCREGESDGYSGIIYVLDGKGNRYSGEGEEFRFGKDEVLTLYFDAQEVYSGKIIFFGEEVADGKGKLSFGFSAGSDITVSQRDAEEDGYKFILEVERA